MKNEVLSFLYTITHAHTHLQLTVIPLDQVPRDVKTDPKARQVNREENTHILTSTLVYLEYFVGSQCATRSFFAESKQSIQNTRVTIPNTT